ncbi:MAG: family 43 glycosylhydrolase, partial [Bacteroidota bacterium]
MRHLSLLALLLVGTSFLGAQKANDNPYPYPYGNPVITHMYTADAAPHVMPDGRVWMVTSVDHEEGGGYATMHRYHTFSSADMVHWIDHGEVLNVWQVLGSDQEPEGEDWALWAPDMIYHQGTYYLYFPIRILHKDSLRDNGKRVVTSYTAVASSPSPDQPFTVINPRIEGTRGIDPSVFIDDDGEKYLYYGNHFGAKLADNMMELATEPVHMEVNDKDFMEAIWMHKREGKYLVSYHRHYGKPIDPAKPDDPARGKSRLDFGVSDHPLGPFTYGGILNEELGVGVEEGPRLSDHDFVPWRLYQSNHGGIVEFHGKDYLFYHTSALSSWRQDAFQGPGTWTQRSVCVDEITYDEGGNPQPVKQTLKGVNLVSVNQPYALELRQQLSVMEGKANISSAGVVELEGPAVLRGGKVDLGSGY